MARPLAPINAEWVFKLAKLGLTHEEIADIFDVDRSTISKRFSQEFTRARSLWKMSLRRSQTRRAVKDRSDAMLIHLGKTYLGQGDKLTVTTKERPKFIERATNPRDRELHSEHAGGNGHTGNGVVS